MTPPPRAELNGYLLNTLLTPAFEGLRKNLLPGLTLQAFAGLIILGYVYVPQVAYFLIYLGDLKSTYGYLYSAVSTAVFGGVVPYVFLLVLGQVPSELRFRQFIFLVLFWIWKGVEVDALYRAQGVIFGNDTHPTTILYKVVVDQFGYNPLWAAPTQVLPFLWKDCGFSFRKTKEALEEQSFALRYLTVLFSTWMVWIPAVAIIYALPDALQIPLFSIVLCFWTLLLSYVSRR